MTVNPDSTIRTSVPSETLLNSASSTSPELRATNAVGRSATFASTALSAAAFSQTPAAASSQAPVGVSGSTAEGSEVGILAQVIIAIGVIPVELLIITAVLGIHRLMHRKPSRPPQSEANSTKLRLSSLPYLQPKAELEDEQRRRHELHGKRVVYELDGEDQVFQMSDETGRHERYELPVGNHVSWETPLQGRPELTGDEQAQELECPIQGNGECIGVENAQELDSPVQASDYVRAEDASGLVAAGADPVIDSTLVETGGSISS